MSRPELRLSRTALRANIEALRLRIAPSAVMVVVKDDAYGHALPWVVEVAADVGVEWFGSYDVATAVEIRRSVSNQAQIFAWAISTDAEIDDALLNDIDLGVGSVEYLRRIIVRAGALGVTARIHLKIDTGLHRNGVLFDNWPEAVAVARTAEIDGAADLVGIWSHIAEASDAEDDDANRVFQDAVRVAREAGAKPTVLHLTASAASWWRPELHGTVCRIGAFCYGIRSADGPDLEGIQPVATLSATVVAVSDNTAVIAIGCLDGLLSTLVGAPVGTPEGARRLRQIDHTTSVVDGWPGMAVGDTVRVFGPGECGEVSATTLAERIDTVGEEILTRLSPRVRRVVTD